MDMNINPILSFDSTPAASVSLACCQSLCDLLKELPLPGPSQQSLSACLSRNQSICHNFGLIDSQLENALIHAKQQLNELVFNDSAETTATTTTTATTALSPLAMQLSLKGHFLSQCHQWSQQLEANSLETIEPSIRQELDLKLIEDELRDDCNDSDVKYFHSNNTNDNNDDSYSSLGDRVKSRRQHNNNNNVGTPAVVDCLPPECLQSVLNVCSEPQPPQQQPQPPPQPPPSARYERSTPVKTPKKERPPKERVNHALPHDLQTKDVLTSFELILNKLMSDCVEDDNNDDNSGDEERENDMSFDLRIDLKQLNLLMTLSSKLKHSNRMKDLENNLSSKLSSFLSLLTNKMIVWFSKFKETEDFLNSGGDDSQTSSDDNHFWQLLINASKMALNIMTSKGMSSRVVLFEELLEIVINFLSHNLNSKTHVQNTSTKSPTKKKNTSSSSVLLTTSATKRQVTHWTEVLELLSEYLNQNKCLNDSMVLMITRISMNALFLNASEMQTISVQLLTHVFGYYPKHRSSILEELLQAFHRIPRVHKNASSTPTPNVFTRLLMALTTALFTASSKTRDSLTKQLTECLAVISAFVSSFIRRCLSTASSQQNSECDLKSLFEAVLNDLLSAAFSPQTISASLLTQILTKLLINNLTLKNQPLQLRLNSIEFLATISSRLAKLLAEKEDIRSETLKTLNQLCGRQEDDRRRRRDDNNNNNHLMAIIKLLHQHFVANKLVAEKAILCALWVKEKPISDIEHKFFAVMNRETTADDDYDDIVPNEPIDSSTAHLFIKSLELNDFATFGRLFDASLSHVTSSLSLTTNTTQRSRAMKSLSQILVNCSLERSTQLLARADLQVAMKSALLDASTSVREATIDLIGRFVLQSKSIELCEKYCDVIGDRILDTGVSVRKRVIKILRDVCQQFPQFEKCGEIQLRIIKRVNDEGEGIRKLVLETVRDLWFRSVAETTDAAVIKHRVTSLLHVISVMLQTEGTIDSLHVLCEQILRNEYLSAAETIADFVVANVLLSTDSEDTKEDTKSRKRALTQLSAVHLINVLSHICPHLLTKHCDSLQSLMSLSCETVVDIHLRNKLVQSVEKIVQKMANPSPQLMCRLEEDLTKQILQSSAHVLPNCVRCLSTVIDTHTHNHKLCLDLFQRFRLILVAQTSSASSSVVVVVDNNSKPKLLRAVFSLGLFLKHFGRHVDAHSKHVVLEHILALIEGHLQAGGGVGGPNSGPLQNGQCPQWRPHADLICRGITSLGFIVESDPKIALWPQVVDLYTRILRSEDTSVEWELFCAQVVNNFRNYLSESIVGDEEANKAIEWSRESLKQMTSDDDSGSLQSQIIQTYLTLLLDRCLSPAIQIRRVACNVVHVIQSGGHVHPLQLVPHLIAMTTDDDTTIRSRADHVLHEIERKFHGFVAMKAKAGIELSTHLCSRLRCRGFRLLDDNSGDVTSRLATLYHVICTNRQSRRGFIQQLLRTFEVNSTSQLDDENTTTDNGVVQLTNTVDDSDDTPTTTDDTQIQLMFEMVLFFPFSVCDEILYILQQLECIQSVNSTHTSHLFTQLFGFVSEEEMDDKFDDNYDTFAKELIENKTELIVGKRHLLRPIHRSLQRVFLVAFLRKLLKEFYLLKDEKIFEYSPNEPKVWEKPIHRRQIETANLNEVLLRANPSPGLLSADLKIDELLEEFKRFKSVSLTSCDPLVTNQLIAQKLLTIQKKSQKITIDSETTATRHPMDDINDAERKRLLDSIRRTSCSVSLIDIGVLPEDFPKRKTSVSTEKRKKARIRRESSDEEEDSRQSSDDGSDDY